MDRLVEFMDGIVMPIHNKIAKIIDSDLISAAIELGRDGATTAGRIMAQLQRESSLALTALSNSLIP